MATTQRQRLSMHARLVDIMGQEDAEILMEHLPSVAWDQMATKDDLKASELRVLAELAKTNAALVKTNAAIVETNAAIGATNSELARTRVDFKEALLEASADVVELRGEVQLGFARLERRLAWYLVAVAALLVGFGLAVWIPLVGALAEAGSTAPSTSAPTEAAAHESGVGTHPQQRLVQAAEVGQQAAEVGQAPRQPHAGPAHGPDP